jgi:integrase
MSAVLFYRRIAPPKRCTFRPAFTLQLLPELDQASAERLGLVDKSPDAVDQDQPSLILLLNEGRRLYESHIARPRVTGGVRESTRKRYRTVFDKFIPFADADGTKNWNGVDAGVLTRYASHLEKLGRAHKTILNELVTLKQCVNWLIKAGHLSDKEPIDLALRKAESLPAYCYKPQEVKAIVEYCSELEDLTWIGNVVVALACTGLRISELASLKWADVDLEKGRLTLTDETGLVQRTDAEKRRLKSGRSRTFPVHADLLDVFRSLKQNGGYIFRGPRGGRLKPDTVRRVLVRDVITPLSEQFPSKDGQRGIKDGRLHSFRHYFCSTCANNRVPERIVMEWLGHADSEMIKNYYHLHDDESRRQMDKLDFVGGSSGRSAGESNETNETEDDEQDRPEK